MKTSQLPQLPNFISRYFWGDNLQELSINKNKNYIIQTLLEKGDQKAISWLFSIFDKKSIQDLLSHLKLDKKSANFWNIYLS